MRLCAVIVQRHLQHFSQMKRMSTRALSYLFATTETVGNDEPVGWSLANRRHEFKLANGNRDVIFVPLEAEGSSHPAASRSGTPEIDAQTRKNGLFRRHLHERFLMAVTVEDRFPLDMRQRKIVRTGHQEFAQQKSLAGQSLRPFVMRKKAAEFITKHGNATWLEANDGNTRFDFRGKLVKDLQQKRLRTIEHAMVIERTSAAQVRFGHCDAESASLEHFYGSLGSGGMEIVAKGVGPEQNRRRVGPARSALATMEPSLESFWSDLRYGSLRGDSGRQL